MSSELSFKISFRSKRSRNFCYTKYFPEKKLILWTNSTFCPVFRIFSWEKIRITWYTYIRYLNFWSKIWFSKLCFIRMCGEWLIFIDKVRVFFREIFSIFLFNLLLKFVVFLNQASKVQNWEHIIDFSFSNTKIHHAHLNFCSKFYQSKFFLILYYLELLWKFAKNCRKWIRCR